MNSVSSSKLHRLGKAASTISPRANRRKAVTNVVVRGRAQTGRWVDGDVWQQFSFWKTLFAHRNASCAGGATTVPVWRTSYLDLFLCPPCHAIEAVKKAKWMSIDTNCDIIGNKIHLWRKCRSIFMGKNPKNYLIIYEACLLPPPSAPLDLCFTCVYI